MIYQKYSSSNSYVSGELSHNYGKIAFSSLGKATKLYMVIFNSELVVYQRVSPFDHEKVHVEMADPWMRSEKLLLECLGYFMWV